VRELENVIERAMIHSTGDTLMLDDGPGLKVWSPSRDGGTLRDVERRHIEHALRRCGWRINGSGNAAEVLGLHPNTLRFRMKKLGIHRPAAPATFHGLKRLPA
jgi:DNA-binding NtrC family response regulator